ncbi:MAG: signal recognition particle protein Srp19 [Candidatus Lokiarchaeota archaeon]|nr:signal recognition particle protein Srp19 [Candidatus Lokiarchaeota archaeon]
MLKNKGYYVIWPVYFDSTKSRSEGRRVNKKNAIKNPKITDLIDAAQNLGLDFDVNPSALYPHFWYLGNNGNLLVKIKDSKTEVISKIAKELKKSKKKKSKGFSVKKTR